SAAPTTSFYTLSLHDALPIYIFRDIPEIYDQIARTGRYTVRIRIQDPELDIFYIGLFKIGTAQGPHDPAPFFLWPFRSKTGIRIDRKSTRLNSSHVKISYAVF